MKYLPILQELFQSDTYIFLAIGIFLSIFFGSAIKSSRRKAVGIFASLIIYGICEVISNYHTNYFFELLLLFIGTVSLGTFLGSVAGYAITRLKKRGSENNDLS